MILHVDMNSYFASVEQQENPSLRGKAIGVGGKPGTRSIIAAASYEAKNRGVKTAMSTEEALRVCPQLIVVEPHYEKYQQYSKKIFTLLETFSPDLEIFSIDEAFLKLNNPSRNCSGNPPTDRHIECHCEQSEAIYRQKIATVATLPRDDKLMHKVVLGINSAHQIKQKLKTEIGEFLTASIGISYNKKLAKLASESMKPNGLVVILKDEQEDLINRFICHSDPEFIEGEESTRSFVALSMTSQRLKLFTVSQIFSITPVEQLCGIGYKLSRRLKGAGIYTLEDLSRVSFEKLKSITYPYEKELYLIGQGIDPSPLVPYWQAEPEKSIGHQYTLPADIKISKLKPYLYYLSEKVGARMRKRGFVAKKVYLYLRFSNRTGWSAFRGFNDFLESNHDIFQATWSLIDSGLKTGNLDQAALVRMPSVSVSHLYKKDRTTIDMFARGLQPSHCHPECNEGSSRFSRRPRTPFGTPQNDSRRINQKNPNLIKAIDLINKKYGQRTVVGGLSANVKLHDIPDGRRKRDLI